MYLCNTEGGAVMQLAYPSMELVSSPVRVPVQGHLALLVLLALHFLASIDVA